MYSTLANIVILKRFINRLIDQSVKFDKNVSSCLLCAEFVVFVAIVCYCYYHKGVGATEDR